MCLTCKELVKRLEWYDRHTLILVSSFHKSARCPTATYVCVRSQPRWSNDTVREFKYWLTANGFARSGRFTRKGAFAYGMIKYMIQVIL